jgi:hypothetical protein
LKGRDGEVSRRAVAPPRSSPTRTRPAGHAVQPARPAPGSGVGRKAGPGEPGSGPCAQAGKITTPPAEKAPVGHGPGQRYRAALPRPTSGETPWGFLRRGGTPVSKFNVVKPENKVPPLTVG